MRNKKSIVNYMIVSTMAIMVLSGCGDSTPSETTIAETEKSVDSTEAIETFDPEGYAELDYEYCFRLEKEASGSKVCARGYLTQSLGDDEYVMEDYEGRQIMYDDARESKDVRFMVGDAIAVYGTYEQVVNVETVGGVNVDTLYITADYIEADSLLTGGETEVSGEAVEASGNIYSDEYIIFTSNTAEITDQELEGMSDEELRIAVNEIYARHGRKFKSEDLQTYFDSKSWYVGNIEPDQFDESVLSEIEKANVQKINDKRNSTQTVSVNAQDIYGLYECHEGGLDASLEVGEASGDGSEYISLIGSSSDGSGYGEFYGTVVSTKDGNYTAVDDNGNVIDIYFSGAGNAQVSDSNMLGGMSFPSFTGTYQKTGDFSNAG